jgi:hypothetical protein
MTETNRRRNAVANNPTTSLSNAIVRHMDVLGELPAYTLPQSLAKRRECRANSDCDQRRLRSRLSAQHFGQYESNSV